MPVFEAVCGVVFARRTQRVVRLETRDVRLGISSVKQRVFSRRLCSSSPPRVSEDVDVWREERHATSISDIHKDARFFSHDLSNFVEERIVERR